SGGEKQGNARAVKQARKAIATQVVRAQQVLSRSCRVGQVTILSRVGGRRDEVRQQACSRCRNQEKDCQCPRPLRAALLSDASPVISERELAMIVTRVTIMVRFTSR